MCNGVFILWIKKRRRLSCQSYKSMYNLQGEYIEDREISKVIIQDTPKEGIQLIRSLRIDSVQ